MNTADICTNPTRRANPPVTSDYLSPSQRIASSLVSQQPDPEQVADNTIANQAGNGIHPIRLGAKAVISDRDRVLLIREQRTDGSLFWTLPGGGLKPGESHREGLRREVDEELQCRITVGETIARCRYDHTTWRRTVTYYLVFTCELDGRPTPNPAHGIIEYKWVPSSDLPATTLDPFRRLLQTHTPQNGVNDNG